MRLARIVILFLTLSTVACQQGNRQSYGDAVLSRPMPTDEGQRVEECNWIRSEIARQQSLGQVGTAMATTPLMTVVMQAAARKNIAALESRASNVQCTAAFSNAPAAVTSTPPGFEQCFARCQQYTSRTKEQCFDACNK
jgi:hypothetical protein